MATSPSTVLIVVWFFALNAQPAFPLNQATVCQKRN